jgi:hypothetical protein
LRCFELSAALRDLEAKDTPSLFDKLHTHDVTPRASANLAKRTQGVFQTMDDPLFFVVCIKADHEGSKTQSNTKFLVLL